MNQFQNTCKKKRDVLASLIHWEYLKFWCLYLDLRTPSTLQTGEDHNTRILSFRNECYPYYRSWALWYYDVCVCVLSRVPLFWDPMDGRPTRLLCTWDFPGMSTGAGCHFLLQGIFPNQRWNPCLLYCLHWQEDPLLLRHPGSPIIFFFFLNLLILAALGLSCSSRDLCCSTWDLVPQPGTMVSQTWYPAAISLKMNHVSLSLQGKQLFVDK